MPLPFVLNVDSPPYFGHDMFPNSMYRRLHERHHDPLDMHTLGVIASLGAHVHQLVGKQRNGELTALGKVGERPKSNTFEINLDVGLFTPEELSVKLVKDCIVVEGKHEEREDEHGHVSRHFVRRYVVPKEYNLDAITSTVSTDGVLKVSVPRLVTSEETQERIIDIKQVGPSNLFLKKDTEEAKEQEKDQK